PYMYFGAYCTSDDLEGGAAADNAKIAESILKGEIRGPKRNIVLLNSAASLLSADIVKDLHEGIRRSEESIDSGAAYDKLVRLIEYSKNG
ncbi:MAG: anthranilate phosphoribosyltransferase, partial [Lentisphaerae bacterium]|nr:anthranilate phosphoribosyltransferase [Lentisphaerota bacterium]